MYSANRKNISAGIILIFLLSFFPTESLPANTLDEADALFNKGGIDNYQVAIELNPKRPEGYYYYGLSVGTYADGVSILTALAEGLKSKNLPCRTAARYKGKRKQERSSRPAGTGSTIRIRRILQ